jgi:hypothetical protein
MGAQRGDDTVNCRVRLRAIERALQKEDKIRVGPLANLAERLRSARLRSEATAQPTMDPDEAMERGRRLRALLDHQRTGR